MKQLSKIIGSTLGLLAFLKVVLLFWATNKGIEMTDEGYYLLWFKSAHLYPPDMHLNYYYLVQMLAGWVNWDLQAMRIAGVLIELLSISVLTAAISKYLKAYLPTIHSKHLIGLIFVSGVASIFLAEHPRSISYDSITFLLMSSASGLLLYWLSVKGTISKYLSFTIFTVLGFILMAQFLVKFSSAILMALVWFTIMAFNRRYIRAQSMLAGSFTGIGIFTLWFFVTQLSPATIYEYYQISYERISGLGYTPWNIFWGTYVSKDLPHFLFNIGPAILVLVTTSIGLAKYKLNLNKWLPVLLSFTVIVVQLLLVKLNYFPQTYYRYIDLVMWGLLSLTYLLWRYRKLSSAELQIIFILGALPFVCAIGSAINMPMSLFSNIPAWVMLLMLLWQILSIEIYVSALAKAFQYLFVSLSFVVFVYVFVWPQYLPHGFAAPLYQQTYKPLENKNVLVDNLTAEFIIDTKALLEKGHFKPNNYILALYDLPGLVYLMDAYSPQVTWYFGETTRATLDEAVINTTMHINNITEDKVYIIKPTEVDQRVVNSLANSKLNFPNSYYLQGFVFDPYSKRKLEVWSPKDLTTY